MGVRIWYLGVDSFGAPQSDLIAAITYSTPVKLSFENITVYFIVSALADNMAGSF